MGKLRLREGKQPAHTARKLQSWDLNPGGFSPQICALVTLPPRDASAREARRQTVPIFRRCRLPGGRSPGGGFCARGGDSGAWKVGGRERSQSLLPSP